MRVFGGLMDGCKITTQKRRRVVGLLTSTHAILPFQAYNTSVLITAIDSV